MEKNYLSNNQHNISLTNSLYSLAIRNLIMNFEFAYKIGRFYYRNIQNHHE
jgi:hypothetical protein